MSDDVPAASAPDTAPSDAATAPALPDFSAHRRSALRRLQWAAQFAWLLPLVAFAVLAGLLYRQAMSDAEQAVAGASRVAQEQALKLFETNAMLLQRMLDLLGDLSDEQVLARGAKIHARLKSMAAELPQGQVLLFIGADARMVANSLGHLMTGYAERLQDAVRRRFEVLPKPVPPHVLADAIATALR